MKNTHTQIHFAFGVLRFFEYVCKFNRTHILHSAARALRYPLGMHLSDGAFNWYICTRPLTHNQSRICVALFCSSVALYIHRDRKRWFKRWCGCCCWLLLRNWCFFHSFFISPSITFDKNICSPFSCVIQRACASPIQCHSKRRETNIFRRGCGKLVNAIQRILKLCPRQRVPNNAEWVQIE